VVFKWALHVLNIMGYHVDSALWLWVVYYYFSLSFVFFGGCTCQIQTLNISFFIYTIISYHLPKKRYNIIYIISWKEWYDRISYIIFLSFQKKLKFYILFINNQSSKHTKRRSPLSLIIFYSDNGHKLTSKRAVKSTQASNLWRGNLKLGQKLKMT
jgi:hypothetical protein